MQTWVRETKALDAALDELQSRGTGPGNDGFELEEDSVFTEDDHDYLNMNDRTGSEMLDEAVDEMTAKMKAKAPKRPTQPDFAEFDKPLAYSERWLNWRPTFPVPLRSRPRPPVIPDATCQGEDRRDSRTHRPATITILNVNDTDYPLPRVGKIARLRIVQVLGCSSGNYTHARGRDRSPCKIVLGTVPVEDDGSVHFLAPIDKGIYFQLLDERGLAIQSMKSVTYVHAGEQLTCRGCHESYTSAPAQRRHQPQALRRAPSVITPETPDGKLAINESYIAPAVERVLQACTGLPGGPKTVDRNELHRQGWIRHARGVLVLPLGFARTTPDAFGARGCRLWEFINENRASLNGLQKDDIRLTALWLDLLGVDDSIYQENQVTGLDGRTWPRHPDLDVHNPLGLDVPSHRPTAACAPVLPENARTGLAGAFSAARPDAEPDNNRRERIWQ
jgi:hypothetical protein